MTKDPCPAVQLSSLTSVGEDLQLLRRYNRVPFACVSYGILPFANEVTDPRSIDADDLGGSGTRHPVRLGVPDVRSPAVRLGGQPLDLFALEGSMLAQPHRKEPTGGDAPADG